MIFIIIRAPNSFLIGATLGSPTKPGMSLVGRMPWISLLGDTRADTWLTLAGEAWLILAGETWLT